MRVGGDWIQLKDKFYLFFFLVSKVILCRRQLLSFEQGDNESLGSVGAILASRDLRSPSQDF